MKGAWFVRAYFVCNGAREFKIWRQKSWKPFRLLSFGNKSLSLDRNSSRNKRLSKFLYFWWTINLGFCFSKWVFKILKVQFQLWQNFGNKFGYIGDLNQKEPVLRKISLCDAEILAFVQKAAIREKRKRNEKLH